MLSRQVQNEKGNLMDEIGLPRKEIVRLLVKHGEDFACYKVRVGVSPWEAGASKRRIVSSGAALRKQVDSGDFYVSVQWDRYRKLADGRSMWSVSLKVKFGTFSPAGTRRADLEYDVVGPTPAQLRALHESDKLALASKVKGLPPKRTLKTRTDTL
jgi:hypothetical protein